MTSAARLHHDMQGPHSLMHCVSPLSPSRFWISLPTTLQTTAFGLTWAGPSCQAALPSTAAPLPATASTFQVKKAGGANGRVVGAAPAVEQDAELADSALAVPEAALVRRRPPILSPDWSEMLDKVRGRSVILPAMLAQILVRN